MIILMQEFCVFLWKKIIPLSEDEARDWVEEHMDVDDYIELFGECEE